MSDLPFELPKRNKSSKKYDWKRRGLIFTKEEFEEIYNRYIWASHCELCGNPFKSLRDRCMDHDHITGKFRNIVCQKCNLCKSDKKFNTNTGEQYISKTKNKEYVQGFCYRIRIIRNSKEVLCKIRKTLEEAIEVRDKFIEENPQYFT